jgi:ribonucleoside-diphosphate reductase alpha chain
VSIDWAALREAVRDGVHFLDNVIDVNEYPLPEIARSTLATRKIGLGVMGVADLLIELGIPYDHPDALGVAGELASFVERESLAMSAELARQRGAFPAWASSRWCGGAGGWEGPGAPLRNATTTTVAPTGTISLIAGCSSGIEPLFALAYERHVLDGEVLVEVHEGFRRRARERCLWTAELAAELARRGSARGLDAVPADLQRLFPTAHDLPAEVHLQMQAVFQRHVHAAVSKTINLPANATPEDVWRAFRSAHELGCKGITVYRDRSKSAQVLSFGLSPEPASAPEAPTPGGRLSPRPVRQLSEGGASGAAPVAGRAAEAAGAPVGEQDPHITGQRALAGSDEGLCPLCATALRRYHGCELCTGCGWSACG